MNRRRLTILFTTGGEAMMNWTDRFIQVMGLAVCLLSLIVFVDGIVEGVPPQPVPLDDEGHTVPGYTYPGWGIPDFPDVPPSSHRTMSN
jgi:hypothetical protein